MGVLCGWDGAFAVDPRVRTKPQVSVESFPEFVLLTGRSALPLMTLFDIEGSWIECTDGMDKDRPAIAFRVESLNGTKLANVIVFVDREVRISDDGYSPDDVRQLQMAARGMRWRAKCYESVLIEWSPKEVFSKDLTIPIRGRAKFGEFPQIRANFLGIEVLQK